MSASQKQHGMIIESDTPSSPAKQICEHPRVFQVGIELSRIRVSDSGLVVRVTSVLTEGDDVVKYWSDLGPKSRDMSFEIIQLF